MRRNLSLMFLVAATIGVTFLAAAQDQSAVSTAATATLAANANPTPDSTASASSKTPKTTTTTATAATTTTTTAPIRSELSPRIEGEKRFRANCSRCHAAPDKFPPRMAATILRHMRVRATITDEDARLILRYLAQ